MATPPKPLPTKATKEIGRVTSDTGAVPSWWQVADFDEDTPELRWPECNKVYDAMRTQDTQVASVISAVSLPIRATTWRIDPAGARPEVVDFIARDLGLPVKGQDEQQDTARRRGRFQWSEHLRLALLMLPFGHSVFEQVYRIDEQTGMAHLRKLAERPAKTITKWNVAPDGGLVSIEQGVADTKAIAIKIPVEHLVVYTYEREGARWWGRSILRTAYKNWLLKDRTLRTSTEMLDRNGMGVPVYEGAPGEEDLSEGQKIATGLRSGEEAGAAVPNGASLDLKGVTGQLPDGLPWAKYHDESIARGVLAHFLNLGQAAGTGSWALGTTLGDFFTQSLQALAQQIADTATAHIVEDIVDVNWGPDEPAPRIVFDEIGSRAAAVAQALQVLVQAGVVTPDGRLEAYIRSGLGLPAEDPSTAKTPDTGGAQQ